MVKKLLMAVVLFVCGVGISSATQYTDELTAQKFGFTAPSTAYAEKEYTSDATSVKYKAQMAADALTIQLRSANSNSGIIVAENPNNLRLVSAVVEWSDKSANARVMDMYSGSEAFTSPSQLYNISSDSGISSIHEFKKSDEFTNSFVADGDIYYFGVRSKSGALYLEKITLVWEEEVSDLKPAELSFGEESAYRVDLGQEFTAPELLNPNGLAVSYSSDNEEVATVDAATGALMIKSYGNVRITAESEETAEFKAGKASYSLSVVAIANNVAEIYAFGQDETTEVRVNFPLYVTYKNGINCYVVSEDNQPSLIYGTTEYQRGDMIPAGWVCTYALFNGLPEIKPAGVMPAPAGQVEIEYPSVPAAEITEENVNGIFYLEGIKFEAATPTTADASKDRNFVGKDAEEAEYTFRANFSGVPSVEPGTYNVMVAVSYYKNGNTEGTLQFYPISYDQRTVPEIRFGDVGVVAGDDLFEMSEVAVSEGINPDEIGFVFYDTNFVQIESLRPNIYVQDDKWYIQPNNTCGVFYVLVDFAGNEQYLPMTTDFVIAVYPNIDYVKVAINGEPVIVDGTNEITGEETADLTFEAPEGYTVYYRELTGEAQEGEFIKYENGSNIVIKGNGKVEYKAEAAGRESEIRIVTYSISTAVEMIEAADGNAEIYTLDGVRVNSENIETGLYILVRDGKATKIRVVK